MRLNTLALVAAMPLLAGCLGSYTTYYTYTNPDYSDNILKYYANNHEFQINVSGAANEKDQLIAEQAVIDVVKVHPKLQNAKFITHDMVRTEQTRDIAIKINIDAAQDQTINQICKSANSGFNAQQALTEITTMQMAYCVDQKTISYATLKMNQPTALNSDTFATAFRSNLAQLLKEDADRGGCNSMPCN